MLHKRNSRLLLFAPQPTETLDTQASEDVKGIFVEEMLGPNGVLVSGQTRFGD